MHINSKKKSICIADVRKKTIVIDFNWLFTILFHTNVLALIYEITKLNKLSHVILSKLQKQYEDNSGSRVAGQRE